MPPVDLETLFCSRSESKLFVSSDPTMTEDPDLPPESVLLPIHGDIRWIKLNKVFDRGQSTIGNANPKSSRSSSKPRSHSRRLKPPNGPILGLPNAAFHANGSRPSPALRIFPLNYSLEKPAVPDPGSPKVSCFGSVLSEGEKKAGRRDEAEVVKGVGCWATLALILGIAEVYPAVSGAVEYEGSRSTDFSGEEGMRKAEDSTAPGLQGMKRFSSGRRSGSRVDGVDGGGDGRVVLLEPLDREGALRLS